MEIEVIQSHINDIEFSNVITTATGYIMDGGNCDFTVKSNYAWKVRVEGDEPDIVTAFDPSGVKNQSGTTYNFTLVNDASLGFQYKDKRFTLVFYSETNEFEEASLEIRGVDYFEFIAGGKTIQAYRTDLTNLYQTWYVYGNVPNNTNVAGHVAGPGDGRQVSPPRTGSCAALPNVDGGNPWRLPTGEELNVMAVTVRGSSVAGALYAHYKFTSGVFYWSATSLNATQVEVHRINGEGPGNYGTKSNSSTEILVRCVRTKK
jgi:hypothetical protein